MYRRYLPIATTLFAIAGFYLYKLDGVGLMGPDEPRYAAIGRAMANSGDFVTPRLWGSAWFEKPPLLYWMSAPFAAAGFNHDLAARLPVTLLSLVFLVAAFFLLWREFGIEAATLSTSMLATCAGWVAYSALCLTDLPMTVFFSLALMLVLPLLRAEPEIHASTWRLAAAGACLGLAALAKGLVPLALALPALWFLRRWWRYWGIAALSCLIVAGPWYLAVYSRNGAPFLEEFFLKHHFERLYSSSLQHVQPWYYYLPILLAGLLPWTPMFAIFARRGRVWDARRSLLLATALFGLLLFSATLNKLPGYLLPLFPALLILLGAEFENRQFAELSRVWLVATAVLIALIPLLAGGLPDALAAGRISALHLGRVSPTEVFYIAAPVAALVLSRRSWTGFLLVLCVAGGGIYLKSTSYLILDERVSARGLWREIQNHGVTVCDGGVNRDWVYGLSFYQDAQVPVCDGGNFDYALRAKGRARPVLEKR